MQGLFRTHLAIESFVNRRLVFECQGVQSIQQQLLFAFEVEIDNAGRQTRSGCDLSQG